MKWYQSRYLLAALVGVILGAFGAAQQACQILAKTHPEEASILGALLIGLALFVNVLPRPDAIVHPAPTLNVERGDDMQVTVNPPADPPPTRPQEGFVPARNPQGQFAKRVPPVDIVADS